MLHAHTNKTVASPGEEICIPWPIGEAVHSCCRVSKGERTAQTVAEKKSVCEVYGDACLHDGVIESEVGLVFSVDLPFLGAWPACPRVL